MNNEVTIKYLQNPATKGWLWKLYGEDGSVIAKSETEFATEADAVAGFEAWQNEVPATPETDAPVNAPADTTAPVAPAEPVTPEEADGKITKEEIHDLETKTPEGATTFQTLTTQCAK